MTYYFYGQKVEEDGDTWYTYINKPIYGTCITLNEKIIDNAIEKHKMLVVSCPGGAEKFDPTDFKKTAMKIQKEFRIPGHPMTLYQKTIHSFVSTPEKEKENNPLQVTLF